MLSIEEFKRLYEALGGEPEFEFVFEGRDCAYMIIKYDDHASFQRCGYEGGSGEIDYADLDWGRVCDVVANNAISLACYSSAEEVLDEHGEILYT